ncbi:hypothetical protein F5Y16DRAFT_92313 [Xylariaceae sp. FL0255]|nr:hypothetical protein F5Y16DRAFT_92313 [Xylariaceae sp. FL0255]
MASLSSLPLELKSRIASFLYPDDLVCRRFVNHDWAVVTSRPLFEILRFSGRPQDESIAWNFGPNAEHIVTPSKFGRTDYAGRKKTADFSQLSETIKEIMELGLHGYTKTFVFDPAYYRDGFWQDYRMLLENEMHEPPDEADLDYNVIEREHNLGIYAFIDNESRDEDDDSGSNLSNFSVTTPDDDDDVDVYELAMERLIQRREQRPEREAAAIEAAEALWAEKMATQTANEDEIVVALASMFEGMNCLDKIQVRPWEFSTWPGTESCNSYQVDVLRRGSFKSVFMTGILARALEAAGRHIRSLHVIEFFIEHFHDTPATRYLFTGLRELSLDMIHIESLNEQAQTSQVMLKVFKCALPMLQRLSLGAGGKWPHLCDRGAHSLLKMLGDVEDESPLVFPKLEYLFLRGMILSTPALLRFINAQPSLKRLEFSELYLATRGFGWPKFIEALPINITICEVRDSPGHEPHEMPDDDPVAYNWMTKWSPKPDDIPGWEMKGAFYFTRTI